MCLGLCICVCIHTYYCTYLILFGMLQLDCSITFYYKNVRFAALLNRMIQLVPLCVLIGACVQLTVQCKSWGPMKQANVKNLNLLSGFTTCLWFVYTICRNEVEPLPLPGLCVCLHASRVVGVSQGLSGVFGLQSHLPIRN